jgi:hypothetical protein
MRSPAPTGQNSPGYRLAGVRRRAADLRPGALVDCEVVRAELRFAAGLRAARCGDSETALEGGVVCPCDRWWSLRTTKAVPPTPKTIGHSTKPVAPIAAKVRAAAGVEWLPLLIPFLIPANVPCIPPMTPLTAAPPTAPAAAAVASAVPVTARTAPCMMFTVQPFRYLALTRWITPSKAEDTPDSSTQSGVHRQCEICCGTCSLLREEAL